MWRLTVEVSFFALCVEFSTLFTVCKYQTLPKFQGISAHFIVKYIQKVRVEYLKSGLHIVF